MIKIKKTMSNFEREPLLEPFGFKGKYVRDAWNVVALLEDDDGRYGVGLGLQSPLWSDSQIFSQFGEITSNNIMYLMMDYALKAAENIAFDNPMQLLDELLPIVFEYGKKITGNPMLRQTFALNALVAVDNTAWLLYCKKNNISDFDAMLPKEMKPAFTYHHSSLASVPLITYGMSIEKIKKIIKEGNFFIKIKIGSDPENDNDPEKMLRWDMQRLTEVHLYLKDHKTSYTENGKIPYYLDANGRYESKEFLMRFLAHADRIGALERIILLEEPFPEEYKVDVSNIPVRLAADESAHSDKDVLERMDLGYKAIALKPIAKTISMSMKIANLAHKRGIPCFCADLTVNPLMVDWNKNFAARLQPLPGMKIGILEANGHQNYVNWENMKGYHPYCGASWIDASNGRFLLNEDFYTLSGGIFGKSPHYGQMVYK